VINQFTAFRARTDDILGPHPQTEQRSPRAPSTEPLLPDENAPLFGHKSKTYRDQITSCIIRHVLLWRPPRATQGSSRAATHRALLFASIQSLHIIECCESSCDARGQTTNIRAVFCIARWSNRVASLLPFFVDALRTLIDRQPKMSITHSAPIK